MTRFDDYGHPGRFNSVLTVGSGDTYLTGSRYGVGGVLVSGSGYTATDYVELSKGGTVLLRDLAAAPTAIYELSVSHVSSSATGESIYLFYRNPNVI